MKTDLATVEAINGVFDQAYNIFANDSRQDARDIYRRPYCIQITDIARRLLSDLEIPSFVIVQEWNEDRGYHKYLGVGNPNEPVIADGTWQQFIPSYWRKMNMLLGKTPPKVLLGAPQEAVSIAREYGVREALLGQWAIKSKPSETQAGVE